VWGEVGSSEFNSKYVSHSIPAVSKLASMKEIAFHLTEDIKDLESRLHRLEEDEHHNKLSPAELYRMIKDLQSSFESNLDHKQADNSHEFRITELESKVSKLQETIQEQTNKINELEVQQADIEKDVLGHDADIENLEEQMKKKPRPF